MLASGVTRFIRRSLAIGALCVANAPAPFAQEAKGASRCAPCTVMVVPDVTLPSQWRDGGIQTRPRQVVRSGQEFWVIDDGGRSYRFSRTGRHLGPIGRPGDGPGEYKNIGYLLKLENDTTAVIDDHQRRVSVLDSRGRFARSYYWPGDAPFWATLKSDGGIVANIDVSTRSSFGLPLHMMTRHGAMLRSFGADTGRNRTGPGWTPQATIVRNMPGDTVLAISAGKGTLSAFSSSGTWLWDWKIPIGLDFAPPPKYQPGKPLVAPVQAMDGWWDSRDGVVWLAFWYPDPNPADATSQAASRSRTIRPTT